MFSDGSCRVHLEQGAANEVLPRVAEGLGAALTVMGAVSRSRLQEAFLGSTAERVLDRIRCDVLVGKPGDFTDRLPFKGLRGTPAVWEEGVDECRGHHGWR